MSNRTLHCNTSCRHPTALRTLRPVFFGCLLASAACASETDPLATANQNGSGGTVFRSEDATSLSPADNARGNLGTGGLQNANNGAQSGGSPFDSGMSTGFDHPFPLLGAHQTAPCTGCHGDPPVFQGIPTECVACHLDDYESSTFPGHDSFPTDCAACHSNDSWSPANVGAGAHPEDRFPLRGPHNLACGDCHNSDLGPIGRGNTDCVGCHQGAHTRNRMDAEHSGIRGYPNGDAAPNFCLACHSDGTEESAEGGEGGEGDDDERGEGGGEREREGGDDD